MENTWFLEYRNETDRVKRDQMLKLAEEEGEDKRIELRRKLFGARYDEKDGQPIDYYIRGFINLKFLKRRFYFPGEKKIMRRDIADVERDWQFPLCSGYGDIGDEALYDELYNLALLYMELCEKDKTFNSVILGLFSITKERREQKIGQDLYDAAVAVPERLDVVDEMKIMTKAFTDAYRNRYPAEAREIFKTG